MKFIQYLNELNTVVNYDSSGWLKRNDRSVGTYIHIDKSNNKVTTNKVEFEQNKWNYATSFIDKSKNGINVFEFGFIDEEERTTATGSGTSYKYSLFAAIIDVFQKLIKYIPDDSVVIFRSSLSETARVNIYNRFMLKIEKEYPYRLTKKQIRKIYETTTGYKTYGVCLSKETYEAINQLEIPLNIKTEIGYTIQDFKNLFK
jgi:hypothetical protein